MQLELNREFPPEAQYIRNIYSQHDLTVIITTLAPLTDLIHSTNASLHDNTYKRLHGNWKEWEVVIWNWRLNKRKNINIIGFTVLFCLGVTIARCYCERETEEAFEYMFSSLWAAIKEATGKEVKFKFIHGEGLAAIVMDGCKPQVTGCGRALVAQARDLENSCCQETDPHVIVQYIVQTCFVHLNR